MWEGVGPAFTSGEDTEKSLKRRLTPLPGAYNREWKVHKIVTYSDTGDREWHAFTRGKNEHSFIISIFVRIFVIVGGGGWLEA